MPDIEEDFNYLDILPTEVLMRIFNYLNPKQLATSRQVCLRWKEIIDNLFRLDKLWEKYCEIDYPNVYKTAKYKAKPGLQWYNIYRSLTLWSRLPYAREVRDEFAAASCVREEIQNFQVLPDGLVGVHKRSGVFYYNLDTLDRAKRDPIPGCYIWYMENTDTLMFLNSSFQLFIVRKVLINPNYEANVTIDNVKMFLLHENNVYFTKLNDELHVLNLNDEYLMSTCLNTFSKGVMSLGYTDNLNILTYDRNIYSLVGKDTVLKCNVETVTNLLHEFRKYNLLEHLDWRVYFQWMYLINRTLPQGPLRDILIIRTYGEVVFVGTTCGVLRIYVKPYVNGQFNLFDCEPIKQYNFMERSDCPVLTQSPIIQIDVVEVEDGHVVLVAMPKKIAVLKFNHIIKRPMPMLLYNEEQHVKVLKTE